MAAFGRDQLALNIQTGSLEDLPQILYCPIGFILERASELERTLVKRLVVCISRSRKNVDKG